MLSVNNTNTFPPLAVNTVAIGSRSNIAISGQDSVQMVSLWNLSDLLDILIPCPAMYSIQIL